MGSPAQVLDDVKALKQAVHDEMELIGCGRFQHTVVAILGFGNVADAVEILAVGYMLTSYEDMERKLTPWEGSFLTAAVFAGMICGGFLGGLLGDIYGRKPVLLTALAINASSAFLSALAGSVNWLIFFRLMAGLGVGGVVSSLFALCLELVPVSARGRYIATLCSFWMFGSVATAGTAWIMLGNDSDGKRIWDISWRYFAAVVGLPSLACFLLTLWYVPESPHFLASRGDAQGVSRVLQYIHDKHGSSKRVVYELVAEMDARQQLCCASPVSPTNSSASGASTATASTTTTTTGSSKPETKNSAQFKEAMLDPDRMRRVQRLFFHPQRVGTLLLMLTSYCLAFGSYGLSSWITKLFQSVGLSNPFANAFVFAGANLPGNIVSLYLIDIVGRKQLLAGALFAAGTCALLFAFEVEGSATIIVLVSCLFNACTTAAWNSFGVLSAESFPLEVRTTGIAIVNCSGRIGAISAQFVNGFLIGPPPHLVALLLVVSSAMASGGIAALNIPFKEEDSRHRPEQHEELSLQVKNDDEDDSLASSPKNDQDDLHNPKQEIKRHLRLPGDRSNE